MPRPKGSKNKTHRSNVMTAVPAPDSLLTTITKAKTQPVQQPTSQFLSFGLQVGDETTCPVCKKKFKIVDGELYRIGGASCQLTEIEEGVTGYTCSWSCFLNYVKRQKDNNGEDGNGSVVGSASGGKGRRGRRKAQKDDNNNNTNPFAYIRPPDNQPFGASAAGAALGTGHVNGGDDNELAQDYTSYYNDMIEDCDEEIKALMAYVQKLENGEGDG